MCDIVRKMISGEIVDRVTRLPRVEYLEKLREIVGDGLVILEVSVTLENLDETFKDIAVSKVASVIKHSVRIPMDMVVRTGEYDFAVILGDGDENVARLVAERIKSNLSYMNMGFGGKTVKVKPVVRISS